MKLWRTVVVLVGMLGALASLAQAQQGKPEPEAVILVASPGLRDADYRQSVVIVVPVENGPPAARCQACFPSINPPKKSPNRYFSAALCRVAPWLRW